jgi:anthranilate phosphoribosyltransferase
LVGANAGPAQEIICLKAVLIFYIVGQADFLSQDIEKAREAIAYGEASAKLRQ